jgi:hypothetical protein
MTMLDRIKKKQLEGFKEFVQNLEVTSALSRQQIFMTGVLEDPLFMGWVTRNLKTIDDFLNLPTSEIEMVLNNHEQAINVFSKSMSGLPEEQIMQLERVLPRHFGKVRDELSYIKELTPGERESAGFFIIKMVRKLQDDQRITGFGWKLPPMDIFYPKTYQDGIQEIVFDSGIVAARGETEKGRRTGPWRHFYDTGKLLAEGEYDDGLKTGQWSIYYTNGLIKSQGKYKSDLKHGQWKEWDRHGHITEVEYIEGSKKT